MPRLTAARWTCPATKGDRPCPLGGQGFFDYTVAPAVAGAYDMGAQLVTQLWAVGVTLLWSGVISAILFVAIHKTIGLRPAADAEREGLDINEHGERAYTF